jgi:excinuclease ABC subunit C
VQRIRDEAHRFAVTYHRKRRELRDRHSEIEEIPGVGAKRKERLLRNFGSLQRVSEATAAELKPFVGQHTADQIVEHFRRLREPEPEPESPDEVDPREEEL